VCQNGKLVLWVQHGEEYPGSFNLTIDIIGTGNALETDGDFVGTVMISNSLVWHIFASSKYTRADHN